MGTGKPSMILDFSSSYVSCNIYRARAISFI